MRTKGALNRRTLAAINEAETGKLQKAATNTLAYLARVVSDMKRDDATRLQAANVLLPYLRPKLSAVEQTNINANDMKTDAQLDEVMKAVFSRVTPQDRAKMALWLVPDGPIFPPVDWPVQ